MIQNIFYFKFAFPNKFLFLSNFLPFGGHFFYFFDLISLELKEFRRKTYKQFSILNVVRVNDLEIESVYIKDRWGVHPRHVCPSFLRCLNTIKKEILTRSFEPSSKVETIKYLTSVAPDSKVQESITICKALTSL